MPANKRPPYQVTWENIAPPYKDYEYFKSCENRPFRCNGNEFDLVNAWWLIEAAALVYAEEEFVANQFHRAGLPEVRFFSGGETECFVANNADCIIMAFRGTESRRRKGRADFNNILVDLKTDFTIKLVDSGHGGKVHKGFKKALDAVWGELLPYIRKIHQNNRTLWVTGHSLGGALATLAAARYRDVQGLYTFGSPRVGDAAFRKGFDVRTYRFVNNNDVVTKVPPPGFYHHVGEERYIDSNGLIRQGLSRRQRWQDGIKGNCKNFFNSLGGLRYGLSGMVPDALKDHVPLLYAVHIWNNIQSGKQLISE